MMFYTPDHMEELMLIEASRIQREANYDYEALEDNDNECED